MGVGIRLHAPPDIRRPLRRSILALKSAFALETINGAPRRRLTFGLYRVRVLVGICSLAGTWILPATAAQKTMFLLLVGLLYLPYGTLLAFLAKENEGLGMQIAGVIGDLAIVFMFHTVVPETRFVALFGYILIVTVHTYLGGRTAGLSVGAGIALLTVLAEWLAPARYSIDAYTLVMFNASVLSMVLLLHVITSEQRRANQRLVELHRSLRIMSSTSGVTEVLDGVAQSIKQSLNALFALVLLRQPDQPPAASVQGIGVQQGMKDLGKQDIVTEDALPSSVAMSTGKTIVVDNIETDARFSRWSDVALNLGFKSMMSVPLQAGTRVIGALNVYFADAGRVGDEEKDLAQAYAEQASAAIIRAESYEREKSAAKRLREVDSLKDEFISMVSHELRTPLTVIVGFSETLARNWERLDDSSRLDFVKQLSQQGREMKRMVEQLLDFSKLSEGREEIRVERLELHDMITRIVATLSGALLGHRVDLEFEPGIWVSADRDAVERIFVNLLTNAVKFSPGTDSITILATTKSGEVEIAVQDHGVGIAESDKKKVFERYYQVPGQTASRKGTGIGLSIAKHYVDVHGGRIWIESVKGVGTTFRFTLPAAA
ncbi:MAG TPA: GAF domain-containing sensor histidine kinase [Actinomycetota bacterium]|nr:GAF domain-containing sensor histidine kinase [Actinomycetota bacterium]